MPPTLEIPDEAKLDPLIETLRRRGTIQLKVWGASMLPSLWPGDFLTIDATDPARLVMGDMVLVARDRRFFVHRLIGRREVDPPALWITRGDSMPQNDPPATASDMLGRVANVWRGKRSFAPVRCMSMFNSALAWLFCRSDHCRNFALRIHADRLRTASEFHVSRCAFESAGDFRDLSEDPGCYL